jgi:hypothetical protein
MMTHVRYYEVLLDVHQVVNADASQFRELLPALLQEGANGITLLTLKHSANERLNVRSIRDHTTTDFLCPLPSQ